jgi:PKD repeat protein
MVEEYLIDKDGVHFVKQINIPIIRSIDISISGSKVMLRRIVNNQLNLVYCHFDTSNGQLTELSSFAFPLVHTMYNWSGCFSPDETKYYWSAMTMVNGKWSNRVDLMQIPLENNMPQFAKNTIFKSFVTTGLVYANEMKNGPDGKIYILSGFKHKIHKINSPNLLSTNCEFVENFHNECSSTFPYVATWSAPFPCRLSLVVSNFCYTEATQFSIENGQSIQSYLWNFGDGHTSTKAEPSHIYEKSGKYSVSLEILKSDNSTENISKEIEINEKPLKPVIVKSSD